jgi:hypothetical protein
MPPHAIQAAAPAATVTTAAQAARCARSIHNRGNNSNGQTFTNAAAAINGPAEILSFLASAIAPTASRTESRSSRR